MDAPVSDITIPAADAKRIAQALRHESKGGHRDHIGCPSCEAMWRAADLLDPPPAPSLRDEVQRVIFDTEDITYDNCADAVLAVVRRHIEGMSSRYWVSDSPMLRRDDVLRLLGGDE